MIERIAAELGIRRLHALCADAVWRKDMAAFVDCFTEDAEWKIAGQHFYGREAIGSGLEQFLAASERVLMSFNSPILDGGHGELTGRTYTVEHVKRVGGEGVATVGVYYERFVQQGDRWRFRWRHFDLCYFGPPDLSAPLFEIQDFGAPPALPGADDPTAGVRVEQ